MSKYYYGKMNITKKPAPAEVEDTSEAAMSITAGDEFGDVVQDQSAVHTPTTTESPSQPTDVEEEPLSRREAFRKMMDNSNNRTIFILIIVILLALGVVTGTNGFSWLFDAKAVGDAPLGEIGIVLAPLLALALAIERFVETLFDYFEGSIENVARIADISKEGIEELEANLNEAWQAYSSAATDIKALTAAEAKLTGISEIFLGLPKNPIYVSYKRRLSIGIGFMLGFVVAIFTDEGMFEYLQISVPRILDMLITGAALGAGAGPMHSLVGSLDGLQSSLKNFGSQRNVDDVLAEVRRMVRGSQSNVDDVLAEVKQMVSSQ